GTKWASASNVRPLIVCSAGLWKWKFFSAYVVPSKVNDDGAEFSTLIECPSLITRTGMGDHFGDAGARVAACAGRAGRSIGVCALPLPHAANDGSSSPQWAGPSAAAASDVQCDGPLG